MNALFWISTLYLAEGLPYIAVNTLSVIMYKNMGISNAEIAFFTGWLYLPWVIKPFWSPFVDILRTKRWWVLFTQISIALAFGLLALLLPGSLAFKSSLIIFWIIGFLSATHDIAADGFYMKALDSSDQSFYVGFRSAFYRLATILGQGGIVMGAGYLEKHTGSIPLAWSLTFAGLSLLFLLFALWHVKAMPSVERNAGSAVHKSPKQIISEFGNTFATFFKKREVVVAILFMLLYRFPEAQLVKMINPFLLDATQSGGLGMDTSQVGLVYGTIGIIGLTLGGILGGMLVSRYGLKRCLWPMALALTLPCAVFCWMSMSQPYPSALVDMVLINAAVFFEQFGYGVGFTSFMLYMIYFSQGELQTSHYSICTAFMALGMMIPGMFAGWIQQQLGYVGFFWWIMGCCLVTLAVTALIKVDSSYGIKQSEQ